MISDWNELFGVTEETTEQKNLSTPAKKTLKKQLNSVQKSTFSNGNRITQADLETLKNDLLVAMNYMIPQGLETHIFSRENLIHFIGKRGSRGTKLCELRDFFYPTPVGEIDKEVQKLRKERLIKKNRCGWMSLSKRIIQ